MSVCVISKIPCLLLKYGLLLQGNDFSDNFTLVIDTELVGGLIYLSLHLK